MTAQFQCPSSPNAQSSQHLMIIDCAMSPSSSSSRIGLSLVFGKQTTNNGPTNWPFSHFCLANEHRPLTTIA
ncbi:hypothetical protein ACLKA6_016371 [Drosophila palustris]